MREVLDAIRSFAAADPDRPAITGAGGPLSYGTLAHAIERARIALDGCPTTVGLLMPRGAMAVVADLALAALGRTIVPLPEFFSEEQWRHMIADASVGAVVTDATMAPRLAGLPVPVIDLDAAIAETAFDERTAPQAPQSRRIIYTSGTTGRPKGVVLEEAALSASLGALERAVAASPDDVHLSVLPFALLLEQLAGVLLPLKIGARIQIAGSPAELMQLSDELRPTTTILVPDLLAQWTGFLRQSGRRAPDSLRFVAVGGAPVGAALAEAAWQVGIPVHEGYGLSECCSVVAVNRAGERRAGSVGRPLDHVAVTIAGDGEIVVRGPSVMSGYLGGQPVHGIWRTGDLGRLDDDGRLVVLGRKDDVIVTPAGRNVHPEWIEPMLLADPAIARAAVVAGPAGVTAVLVPRHDDPAVRPHGWVARAHALTAAAPAYARPVDVVLLSLDDVRRQALFTLDGRPRRRLIAQLITETPMTFYEALVDATTPERKAFMSIPVIRRAVTEGVDASLYLAFLASAYAHVRHTVPLMEAALARCGAGDEAMIDGLKDYVAEEIGHDEWILDDIAALGGDAEAVRNARPPLPVRAMVAYAYHLITEEGPYALLGMVHVLEGMSVALADKAAAAIRERLAPAGGGGFSYLTTHGGLDVAHVDGFAQLLSAVDTPERRAVVIAAARDFYQLYGDVFRGLADEGARHAA